MSTQDVLANRQLVFSSTLENLSLVEKLIDDISSEFDISEEIYGNIIISITEAVNNAIKHGNNNDPQLQTKVECHILPNHIKFIISDEGNGFDYNNLPDPTLPENLEKISGRGVFLMQQLSEDLKFNNSGNQVELYFSFAEN